MDEPINKIRMLRFILNTLIFLAGFASCFLINCTLLYSSAEVPFRGFGLSANEINASSPADRIKLNQIQLTEDSIIIKVPNVSLSSYAPTGSMKPVFDKGANGIRVVPKSPEEIQIGDIVTFGKENIVHRVIEKGIDEKGYWFVTKGDNNEFPDEEKIRFEDIKYITIGILY